MRDFRSANILAIIADFLGAVILFLYAIIVGPLGVLRGPIAFERSLWYLWVLLPQGLLTRSIRAAIDWRLGNFDAAIAQLEGIVGANEDYFKDAPQSRSRKRVLEDIYTVLTRAYLHSGHIDDAMLVIIRAKKCLGIERLGGLAEIDAKTAHLVRAGLAAGRLLDGGGLATMFVKTTATTDQDQTKQALPPKRQGGSVRDTGQTSPVVNADDGAKIIPFKPRVRRSDGPAPKRPH
jgi:hypothetical protein